MVLLSRPSPRRPGPALSLHTTDGPSAQTRTARLSPGPDHGPDQARHTIPPHPHSRPDGATLACSPLPRKRRHDAAPHTRAPAQLELILTQVSPSQHGPRPPWARTRTADVPHARSRFHKHANALFKASSIPMPNGQERAPESEPGPHHDARYCGGGVHRQQTRSQAPERPLGRGP